MFNVSQHVSYNKHFILYNFSGNGKIEFSEFLTLMEANLNAFESEELIRGAFEVLDPHGDGYITLQGLRQVNIESFRMIFVYLNTYIRLIHEVLYLVKRKVDILR